VIFEGLARGRVRRSQRTGLRCEERETLGSTATRAPLDADEVAKPVGVITVPVRPRTHTGAVSVVPRGDSALRLNVHLHVLVLDGVYVRDAAGKLGSMRSRRRRATKQLQKALRA
jgi:hypothetical protein